MAQHSTGVAPTPVPVANGHRSWSRRQIGAVSIAGGLAFAAIVVWIFSLLLGGNVNPLANRTFWVNPTTSAAAAAASATGSQRTAFLEIAGVPTSTWLLPEQHPTSEISAYVDKLADQADAASAVPIFTVYGIPNRDCSSGASSGQSAGGQSAGGTSEADYPAWIAAIAAGLGKHVAVVILEPDSLSLSTQCNNTDARVAQLSKAIDLLTVNKASIIYLDGGHSTWLGATAQADLLNRAGVSRVRGFATNVSNFNSTANETAYGNEVSSLTNGSHYVVDTGRNGNGGTSDWCNPPGRALGEKPAAISDGSARDADLWVKNPGESDGSCNGGPAAGQWWPAGALALVNG